MRPDVLAEEGDDKPVLIADIAERHNLPKKFLEQILLEPQAPRPRAEPARAERRLYLAQAGVRVSFGPVVRIIDGPLAPPPCLSVMAYRRYVDCPDEESCAIQRVFALTRQATSTVLDRTTLADALKEMA